MAVLECPACLNTRLVLSETLSTAALADRWAASNFHGSATPDQIRCFVTQDIGDESVRFYVCAHCWLEFADPARTWSAAHYPHEEHSLGWDHDHALKDLAALPARTLLDVGCASGQFLSRAAALGHRVTGVDFSTEDIEATRAQGFEAYVANLAERNPLIDGQRKFDIITLFQVVEHLESPDLVFRELSRLASPGATLILGCPSSRRYTRGFPHEDRMGASDFWDCPPQHVLRWTPSALAAFTSRHGWTACYSACEPLHVKHAAAHLAGLSHHRSSAARRLATLSYRARLPFTKLTGIRLYFRAVRASSQSV